MPMPACATPDTFRPASETIPGKFAVRIGTYTVTAPTEVQELYECALWHKTITVQPGEYPIVAYLSWPRSSSVTIRFTGEITSAYFAPRIGAHIGTDTQGPAMLGKTDTVGSSRYWFQIKDDPNAVFDTDTFTVETGYVVPKRPVAEGVTLPIAIAPRYVSGMGQIAPVYVSVVNRGCPTEYSSVTVVLADNPYRIQSATFPYKFEGAEGHVEANRLAARIREKGEIAAHLWHLTAPQY